MQHRLLFRHLSDHPIVPVLEGEGGQQKGPSDTQHNPIRRRIHTMDVNEGSLYYQYQ